MEKEKMKNTGTTYIGDILQRLPRTRLTRRDPLRGIKSFQPLKREEQKICVRNNEQSPSPRSPNNREPKKSISIYLLLSTNVLVISNQDLKVAKLLSLAGMNPMGNTRGP